LGSEHCMCIAALCRWPRAVVCNVFGELEDRGTLVLIKSLHQICAATVQVARQALPCHAHAMSEMHKGELSSRGLLAMASELERGLC
jgi:hypothetical protein